MKIEDKIKICARLFFQEGNDYEDYREAYAEFCANKPSDKFLDFAIEPILKHKDSEHKLFMHKESGHVATLRIKDGFFSPITEMTEDEGLETSEATLNEIDKIPETISDNKAQIMALENSGWIQI